jgi:UPF0716 protein FxsA
VPWLFVAFVVVPLIELAVIVSVQRVVGLSWTLLALLAMSLLGAVLVKREGLKAWRRFRTAMDEARLPTEEVTDGALVLIGGTLMVTPGFLTDLLGLALVIPPSRMLVNRMLRSRVRAGFGLGPARSRSRRGRDVEPGVVDVEVISVEREEPEQPGPAGELNGR